MKLDNKRIAEAIDRLGYRAALKAIRPSQIQNEQLQAYWSMARAMAERIDDCLAPERLEMARAGEDDEP